MFDLRVEIYKNVVLEKENLKFETTVGKTGKLKNLEDNLFETPEQKKCNDFLEQIKKEQKNIDITLFKNVFNYETPDEILEYFYSLKKKNDKYNQETSLKKVLQILKMRLKLCQKVIKKQGNKKIEYC